MVDADEATLPADDPLDDDAVGEPTMGSAAAARDVRPVELPEADRERYAVGEHVASGGGGRIHVAEDTWLGRIVALKRMRSTHDPVAQDRFVREALLTARLQHPGIVPVYEAGRWPDGDPFYAMKLVTGQPLSRTLEGVHTLAERLALLPHVLAVAEAIAYAHSRGVIHRDLKPANVLVGSFGETVVIDWGLGKELGEDDPSQGGHATEREGEREAGERDGELTRAGAVMGTPIYMPPEQARGEVAGPPADVYALGAILYHVLAGCPPYERGTGLEVLARVLTGPPPSLESLVPRVPRELAAIVAKAMAREVGDRYPTAAQLAEDLRRYQTGQIVGAHRYTAKQRVGRWLWRHRTAVSAAAAALLVAVLGGTYAVVALQQEVARTAMQNRLAEHARAKAVDARAKAEQARRSAELDRARADDRADALLLERARIEAPQRPREALESLARLTGRFDAWPQAQVIAANAASHGLASVLRRCEAEPSDGVCVREGAIALMSGLGQVDVLRGDGRIEGFDLLERRSLGLVIPARDVKRADRRGATVVTFDAAAEVRRWDVPTQTSERLGRSEVALSWVRLASERDVVGLEDGRTDSVLWHWRADGSVRQLATCHKQGDQLAAAVASSPGWRWVGCVDREGVLVLAELLGERSLRTTLDQLPRDLAVDDDGRWVAWAFDGESPTIWDVVADRRLHPAVSGTVGFDTARLEFVPGASTLVGGASDGRVVTWEPGQTMMQPLPSHEAALVSLEILADGRRIATTAVDGTLHIYELSARTLRRLEGISGVGIDVELPLDGRAIVARSTDRSVHAWAMTSPEGEAIARVAGPVRKLAVDPTGEIVAVGGVDGGLWLVSPSGGAEPRALLGLEGSVDVLVFAPDGRSLAAGSDGGTLGIWSLDGERRWLERVSLGTVRGLAFAPEGTALLAAIYEEGVLRFEAATGRRVGKIEGARVAGMELLPEGRVLAWSHEGWVAVWEADGVERLRRRLDDEVWVARASQSGDALFVAGRDGRLRRYAYPGGEEQVAAELDLFIMSIDRVGDGQLLTIGTDQRLRLWDAQSLALVRTFEGHRGHVSGVALRDGGARMISSSVDGSARVWDLGSGESRELLGHTGPVMAVAWLPDLRTVLSAGQDGSVRRWPDDVPQDEVGLRRWLDQQLARGR